MSDSPKTTGKIKPDFGTLCRYVEKLEKKLEQRSEEIKRIDSNVHVLMQLIEQKDAEIDRLQAERRWIPIDKVEPPVDRVFLVYGKGQVLRAGNIQNLPAVSFQDVTHWMPLPQPPEEERC